MRERIIWADTGSRETNRSAHSNQQASSVRSARPAPADPPATSPRRYRLRHRRRRRLGGSSISIGIGGDGVAGLVAIVANESGGGGSSRRRRVNGITAVVRRYRGRRRSMADTFSCILELRGRPLLVGGLFRVLLHTLHHAGQQNTAKRGGPVNGWRPPASRATNSCGGPGR